ncbi:hypothetical protein F5884DRAFT_719233 [Xylogone sp. PMI_703]|nr:hypothetical protein F5884DRAFT_719233 [Xylogone sp. PMI_703]
MVKVAIAGGTGGLGRAIVDALETDGTHDFIILTRKQSSATGAAADPRRAEIDYSNIESTTQILNEHGVHTIISALSIKSQEQGIAQLNLIKAAIESSSVKRFTPSEFGTPRNEKNGSLPYQYAAGVTDYKVAAIFALEKSRLEYTLFYHGIFMDYYGLPRVKSYLQPWVFAIDIAHKTAAIPGSGNAPVVYTYSGDVAKFVVASLSLPENKWKRNSVMVGERKTLNEVLHIAESVCKEKFKVTYDSRESLNRGEITELPSHAAFYSGGSKQAFKQRFAGFGLVMDSGGFDFEVPKDSMFLNSIFPDIQPLSVEDVIRAGWE